MTTSTIVAEWHSMISDCMQRESRMTDWEQGFIQSLSEWLADGKSLSMKQEASLERIWEKITEKG